ncbi:MAG: glycerol-3-phosphate transporter permease, partial [Rhodospirillales bacterium]|nr:glycerol-3-phosphate transporter permease [Rhodospirillales bacterium]
MEKRVVFRNRVLPYILVAPQIAVTLIFFIWPASQALYQSVLVEDPFGLRSEFVWGENFAELFGDPWYLQSIQVTAVFSVSVALLALTTALYLAVQADRAIRGAMAYKTLLVWPYAVAPAVAGVLWLFLFNPTLGIVAYALRELGYDWN